MKNSKFSYLPIISESSEYAVCETYLYFLLDTIKVLGLPYIFVQADEQVYARILHIICKHRDLYSKIIPIMDGFHQVRVFQRALFKRYHCLGLQDSFVDSGTITAGSVSQAFDRRHHYHSIRLHREGFHVLVHRKVEDIINKFKLIHLDLLSYLSYWQGGRVDITIALFFSCFLLNMRWQTVFPNVLLCP